MLILPSLEGIDAKAVLFASCLNTLDPISIWLRTPGSLSADSDPASLFGCEASFWSTWL